MKLTKLMFADIYRDGGSYKARFETDDRRIYNIWLQRSAMPDVDGLHYRWLFEYFGDRRPETCLPIVTASEDERALLGRLRDFLGANDPDNAISPKHPSSASPDHLKKLVHYIEHREPCFLADIVGRHFAAIE
jgi:hypothetical protein